MPECAASGLRSEPAVDPSSQSPALPASGGLARGAGEERPVFREDLLVKGIGGLIEVGQEAVGFRAGCSCGELGCVKLKVAEHFLEALMLVSALLDGEAEIGGWRSGIAASSGGMSRRGSKRQQDGFALLF